MLFHDITVFKRVIMYLVTQIIFQKSERKETIHTYKRSSSLNQIQAS